MAARLCGDDDPADVTQDAFVRALERVGTMREYWPLETWIFACMVGARRRATVAGPVPEAPARAVSPYEGDGDPRAAAVRSVLERLTTRQREVVFLRYFADLDEASIAARLGICRGTVASTLHRVHARMRPALDGEVSVRARR
jgi:RNA polymerase sigma factor (sigma-70 family)